MTVEYDKLIRDKIPDIIKRNNKIPMTHIASEKEYNEKLNQKLIEEVNEFVKDQNIGELVDILEVIHAIAENINISKEKLENLRKEKAAERGSFKNKLILDEVKDVSQKI